MNLKKYLILPLLQRLQINFTIALFLFFFVSAVNAQPANDNCANATVLTVGAACTNGTNALATLQSGEPITAGCWFSTATNTVWYTFTTGSAGTYVISTDNGGTTDTQLKLYSSACGTYTEIGCSDDYEGTNFYAAVIFASLAASTQYWIQVDIYGATVGTFCINVRQATSPSNDCVLNAIDLTSLINGVSTTNPYDCFYTYTYNASTAVYDDPTKQDIVSPVDPCGCNGEVYPPPPILTPEPDHYDIWFRFTVSSLTPDAYLHLFNTLPGQQPALLVMALYSGTPTSTCPNGNITGLTQIDCSAGEVVAIPDPFNTYGGSRDQAICSTPLHARLDISGLSLGTYYVRVFDFNGDRNVGRFNLCAESIDPRPYTSDICTSTPNIGYTGTTFNVDVNSTYTTLSNAGNHGNTYGTPQSVVCPSLQPNEPLLGGTPSGEARIGCSGGWINYVGSINNVMNITVIHSFLVNACPTCEPSALIRFNNIIRDGTPGNLAQIQVMAPGNCTGSTQTISNTQTDATCLEIRPLGNAPLPNGMYYIVVDGQDGQLLQYDLTLVLNYPCDSVISCLPLPIELLTFSAENRSGINYLQWTTASEINNDHFDLERSSNGFDFTTIHTVRGAGNSTDERQYFTTDSKAPVGISYYRLKQVDYNGEFTYSNIIAVKNSGNFASLSIENVSEISVTANYNSDFAQSITLRLIDIRGNVLNSDYITITKGINQFKVNTSNLRSGIYMLEAIDQDGYSSKIRFMK
jgi:hypothetical protein